MIYISGVEGGGGEVMEVKVRWDGQPVPDGTEPDPGDCAHGMAMRDGAGAWQCLICGLFEEGQL